MAPSFAEVTAAELADLAADKPTILAAHAIRDGAPSVEIWSQTGATTDSDETETDFPTSRARDDQINLGNHTKPDASQTTWYLSFQLATVQEFDALVLIGIGLHNAVAITVEIADDAAFSTNLREIVSITPGSTEVRYVELALFHTGATALRYTDVEFLRLKITHGAGIIPRVGELWLSRRRQMTHNPSRPLDDQHESTQAASLETKSGVITQAGTEVGAARRGVSLMVEAGDLSDVESFWDDCEEGTRPFWWVETPSSSPKAYLMKYDGAPIFDPLLLGNSDRQWRLPMIEQAQFLAAES